MMDHDVEVALWQRGILLEGDQEIGPACYLFEASISAFSTLLQVLTADSVHYDSESYGSLREEFRKFYMWNEGFSTRTGDLDHVLACSKNLKATVLSLMVQWVKTVSKVPEIMPEFDWSSVFTKFTELQMITSKVEQVAKASISDMKSQYSVFDSFNLEDGSESDSDSDLESYMSEYVFEDIIEDLSTYMESLADLSPSLDHPATDHAFIEDVNTSLIDEFSTVSEPAKPFVLIIRDRFPSLDAGIAKRLGEANWQRRERLRMKLASAPEMGEFYTEDDGNSSTGDTIVDAGRQVVEDQQTIVGTARSSISVTRTFQSTTIESRFSDPSIFDNASIHVPTPGRVRRAESVTSFATSVARGMDYGQRRVPNLPVDHVYGSTFQCNICGDTLTTIRHRSDWKKHVFNDLEPYICLFSNCDLGLQTLQSRREWSYHEFQAHRVNIEWHCNLCKDIFETQELFRRHINKSHGSDIAMSQVEEFMSVSKRLLPCKVEDEICPFCLTKPSQSQGGFASHVGKHQQEISLAALPTLEDFSDDESINDGKTSDDDDDDSDDNDNSGEDFRKKKKGTDDTQTEKGENSAPGNSNLTGSSKPKSVTSQTAALGSAIQAPVYLSFKVKAVCEYISPFNDTLQFPSEQIITVTQEEEGDWYIGEYMDTSGVKQKGFFPKKFVEKYESADALLSTNSGLVVSSQAETITSGIPLSSAGGDPNKMNEKGQPDAKITTNEGREIDPNHFIAESIDAQSLPSSEKKKLKYPLQPSEPENRLDILFESPAIPQRSHSLSQDSQQSTGTTKGPQSRLMFSIQNFEKTLENCEELWQHLPSGSSESLTVLASLEGQLLFLRKPSGYIASRSSNLSSSGIETLIENLAICRTQLLRLQKVLESVDGRADEAENSPRFTRQWMLSKSELSEAQDILTELRVRTEMLERIYTPRSLRRTKVRPGEAGPSFKDDYEKYQPSLSEQIGSTFQAASAVERPALNSHPIDDSSDDRASETVVFPAKLPFDNNIEEQDGDVAYPCKGCGEILEEGKAFELAGNRWHLNCFRCNTCGILLDSDANLLLLGDGSLICNDCTYSCSACGNKIEDLAILTGDQAFCAACFRCRNCKRKIENLQYARTSQGIFCMSCHESLMARRRRKSRAAANTKLKEGQGHSLVDRSLPPLPPLPQNAILQSASSSLDLEAFGTGINLPEADVPPELSPKQHRGDTL